MPVDDVELDELDELEELEAVDELDELAPPELAESEPFPHAAMSTAHAVIEAGKTRRLNMDRTP